MAEIDIIPVTIAAGQSLSPQIDIGTKSLVGLVVPANWTNAGIAFQVSVDGGTTWAVLMDSTTAGAYALATITTGGSLPAAVAISPDKLRGWQSFKLQSQTAGTPTVQTNQVTVQLVTRLAL